LGNYIGIDETPAEMFGKVMSISDELMWRYYELLTDVTVAEIATLRKAGEQGERNPRDIKAQLAKRIIADFHSEEEARRAEEDFNRIFRSKEMPDAIETCDVKAGSWPLTQLLFETGLAESKAEARRLIEQGGVRIGGVRQTQAGAVLGIKSGEQSLLQVGKRRFLKVRAT